LRRDGALSSKKKRGRCCCGSRRKKKSKKRCTPFLKKQFIFHVVRERGVKERDVGSQGKKGRFLPLPFVGAVLVDVAGEEGESITEHLRGGGEERRKGWPVLDFLPSWRKEPLPACWERGGDRKRLLP